MRALRLLFLVSSSSVFAGSPSAPEECCAVDLWTGQGVSVGGWLLPELNYQAAVGSSTTDPERLAVGHHDPDRHGLTHQNIELSLTARVNKHLLFFGTFASKIDHDDRWGTEFEEYYVKIDDLPGDLAFRGGRFQTRFGYQNELHVHQFDFVDQYLGNARMFGEDPLVVYGGEVSTPVLRSLPSGWDDRLTVSFGAIPEPDEEAHEHFGPEGLFEAEGNLFADWAATASYRLGWNATAHKRYEFGLAGAWGKNEFGRNTQVYGLNMQYLWKAACDHEHDHSHAGHSHAGHSHGASTTESAEFFRWRSEVFVRHFGAVGSAHDEHEEEEVEEHGHEEELGEHAEAEHGSEEDARGSIRDEFMDMGFYTAMSYGFPSGKVQAHLRAEYVSGVSEAGLPERWRISPAVAWAPSPRLPFVIKLQYNYDHSPSFGDEHSVWAQFSLTWGDCCVEH